LKLVVIDVLTNSMALSLAGILIKTKMYTTIDASIIDVVCNGPQI